MAILDVGKDDIEGDEAVGVVMHGFRLGRGRSIRHQWVNEMKKDACLGLPMKKTLSRLALQKHTSSHRVKE